MGSRHAGFSSCGAQALLLCGMWDLPGPGLELMSPALAGRFLTTAPPGKSLSLLQKHSFAWKVKPIAAIKFKRRFNHVYCLKLFLELDIALVDLLVGQTHSFFFLLFIHFTHISVYMSIPIS